MNENKDRIYTKVHWNGTVIKYTYPGRYLTKEDREKPKNPRVYRLQFKHKMKIQDAAVYQNYHALDYGHLQHFLTFTLNANEPFDQSNKPLIRVLDNLQKNYELQSYIWVREVTKKYTPHWHVLLEMPYIDYMVINDAWCKARKQSYSNNAVGKDKRKSAIVTNPLEASEYMAKYMGKESMDTICFKKNGSESMEIVSGSVYKLYGMSESLNNLPLINEPGNDWYHYFLRNAKKPPVELEKCTLYHVKSPEITANIMFQGEKELIRMRNKKKK